MRLSRTAAFLSFLSTAGFLGLCEEGGDSPEVTQGGSGLCGAACGQCWEGTDFAGQPCLDEWLDNGQCDCGCFGDDSDCIAAAVALDCPDAGPGATCVAESLCGPACDECRIQLHNCAQGGYGSCREAGWILGVGMGACYEAEGAPDGRVDCGCFDSDVYGDPGQPDPDPDPDLPCDPSIIDRVTDPEVLRLVGKAAEYVLPNTYYPGDLVTFAPEYAAPDFPGQRMRSEAAGAMRDMLDGAATAGHDIRIRSAFRSYEDQVATFQYWVDFYGGDEERANMESARPGHSEHQLGTTADLTSESAGWGFGDTWEFTPEGGWIAANAAGYGFVMSYPAGSQDIVGYIHEPWHYRYFGVELAQAIVASGLTSLEYLECLAAH